MDVNVTRAPNTIWSGRRESVRMTAEEFQINVETIESIITEELDIRRTFASNSLCFGS